MSATTPSLINAQELCQQLQSSDTPVVLDCRFYLQEPAAGQEAFMEQHIVRAQYADLDLHLSGPVEAGVTGRHPLPSKEAFARQLQQWGITPERSVVVYDQNNAAMAAARAWWLLRYAGVEQVQVLDGGLDAWLAEGLATETGEQTSDNALSEQPELNWQDEKLITAQQLLLKKPVLLDARGIERFAGEVEPIDPVAGHIPGAQCVPFTELVDDQGMFLKPEQLKETLSALDTDEATVVYCGSGVTACHLALGAVIAG
ncbi:MAG: sulfurtransferase, partial [Oceanospirillum sp.]|nr:sulfurtransferase [Oceanospirillum sp.]